MENKRTFLAEVIKNKVETIRAFYREYKGYHLVDLRIYRQTSGGFVPGNGLLFRVEILNELIGLLKKVGKQEPDQTKKPGIIRKNLYQVIQVQRRAYLGTPLIDIRVCEDTEGGLIFTKNGIAFRVDKLSEVLDMLETTKQTIDKILHFSGPLIPEGTREEQGSTPLIPTPIISAEPK